MAKLSNIGIQTKLRTLGLAILGFTVALTVQLITLIQWVIKTSLRTLIFFTITISYTISLPVPMLGQKLRDVNRKFTLFQLGKDNPLGTFRTDMMDIMVQQHRPDYTNQREVLRSEIKFEFQKAKQKHELGELLVSIWGSVLAIALSYYQLWPKLSLVISAYVVMMTVSILVRIVVLELLAFDDADVEDEYDKGRLELMLGWNRAILNTLSSQLLILLLGVLGLIHTSGYEVAKEFLKKYYVDEYSKQELLRWLLGSLRW